MENALARQVGLQDIEIDLQTNWVTIRPAGDQYVPLEEIPRTIKRAGYSPAEMAIKATGRVESQGAGTVFRIRGWPESYPISGAGEASETERAVVANVSYTSTPLRLEMAKGLARLN